MLSRWPSSSSQAKGLISQIVAGLAPSPLLLTVGLKRSAKLDLEACPKVVLAFMGLREALEAAERSA